MDFTKKEDRLHLMDMVDHSRKKLDKPRESRRKLLERAQGSEWFDSKDGVPLNQMAQQEWALVQHLAGGDPKAMVIPGSRELSAVAYEQTLAINATAQRVNLRRKFRRLVQDAIYGIGICRIGMVKGKTQEVRERYPELDEEGEIGLGSLELQVISLESWVHDCQADTLDEREFCGHAYWVDKEDIGDYLPGVKQEDLEVEEKRWIDEHGHEMAGAMSRGVDGEGTARYRDKYWLWDLWCPKEQVIITTPVNGTGEIANVRKWNSRPGGPYLFLYYRELPDQAIPISIQADLALVHDSLNSTFRKLIDQTREAKTVLAFKPGRESDAEGIRDAASRGIVPVHDPAAIQEFNFNGPDQSLLGVLLQTRELASIIGGNTDALLGAGAQAPTATQEQIITAAAGGKVALHEVDTADFQREVFEAIRWYIYHEQQEPIPIVGEVEGTDIRFQQYFNAPKAQALPGEFNSFQLEIEPYTGIYRAPEQRFQALMSIWERLIMPAVQLGIVDQTPDMSQLLAIASQYLDMPEVQSLLREVAPEEQQMMEGGEARQSPTTTRNYVRRSAPGPTNKGNAMQAMTMMGAKET
jgi:hypothetical protein